MNPTKPDNTEEILNTLMYIRYGLVIASLPLSAYGLILCRSAYRLSRPPRITPDLFIDNLYKPFKDHFHQATMERPKQMHYPPEQPRVYPNPEPPPQNSSSNRTEPTKENLVENPVVLVENPVVKDPLLMKRRFERINLETCPPRLITRLQSLPLSRVKKFTESAIRLKRPDVLRFISRWMSENQRDLILSADNPPQTHWHRYGPVEWTALLGDRRHQTFVESHLQKQLRSYRTQNDDSDASTGHDALKPLGSENLPIVYGREQEIQKLIHRLQNKSGKNPVLLGEAGVGKTAIVEELARRMKIGAVPESLKGMQVWSLSLEVLHARGAQYSGLLEKELDKILAIVRPNKKVILFIDEMHRMTHMGATQTNPTGSLAQSLKTVLARSELRFIGASTTDEFDKYVLKIDPAFARRWDRIPISEFSPIIMKPLLTQIFEDYCIKGNKDVIISESALQTVIDLAKKHLRNGNSPDREIQVIQEAIESVQLKQSLISHIAEMEAEREQLLQTSRMQNRRSNHSNLDDVLHKVDVLQRRIAATKTRLEASENVKKSLVPLKVRYNQHESELHSLCKNSSRKDLIMAGLLFHVILPSISKSILRQSRLINPTFPCVVTRKTVTQIIADKIGIPSPHLSRKKEGANILELEERLNAKVIGQPQAVSALANAYALYRSGARPSNKPIGTFLFAGPTGTGKTKLAKEFAYELFGSTESCLMYNMAKYQDPFNSNQFIDALSEKLRRHPYSVVVLDEFEKANKNVAETLLQVLDEGQIISGSTRIDCSNTMFILTSNLAAHEILVHCQTNANRPIEEEEMTKIMLNSGFPPEFVNRMTRVLPFYPLQRDVVRKILKHELILSASAIEKEKNITLLWDDSVVDFLTQHIEAHGNYQFFGGRPIERMIADKIMIPFAKMFLAQTFNKGDTVQVFVQDGMVGLKKQT